MLLYFYIFWNYFKNFRSLINLQLSQLTIISYKSNYHYQKRIDPNNPEFICVHHKNTTNIFFFFFYSISFKKHIVWKSALLWNMTVCMRLILPTSKKYWYYQEKTKKKTHVIMMITYWYELFSVIQNRLTELLSVRFTAFVSKRKKGWK